MEEHELDERHEDALILIPYSEDEEKIILVKKKIANLQ